MQRFPLTPKVWRAISLLLGAILAAVAALNRPDTGPGQRQEGRPSSSENRRKAPSRQWERLEGFTLKEDRDNDGDSFILRQGDKTHTFRLYYADCPEKRRHQYNGDRLAEQGAYFGSLSEQTTVSVGKEAAEFALTLLRKGPVIVETRWEKVYEPGRHYAFVTAGGEDLAEALVSRGLARIHTSGAKRPNGLSVKDEKARLQQLEQTARTKRLGAWGKPGANPR